MLESNICITRVCMVVTDLSIISNKVNINMVIAIQVIDRSA